MKEEREAVRRMPPTSSLVPRLSFCSVCCLHRPHHRQPLTPSRYRKRKGKDGHPVRFWAMSSPHLATPRHRLTSNQTGSTSAVCHPAHLVLVLFLPLLQVIRARQSKRASRSEGRERTSAKDAADLFARSSPRLCSVCCPHRPHHRQPFTTSPPLHQQSGRGKVGHPVRLWVIPSIPHRHNLATD